MMRRNPWSIGALSVVIGLCAASAAAQSATSIDERIAVTIRPSRGTYECADGDVARVVFAIDVDVLNATARRLVVPSLSVDIGDERYWRADDPPGQPPRLTIDGKLTLSAGPIGEARPEDFLVLVPRAHHTFAVTHGVVATRAGDPAAGLLGPGTYRAELVIGPGFTLAQPDSVLLELERRLGAPWLTAEWSAPFMLEVGPFPERLPGCSPVAASKRGVH